MNWTYRVRVRGELGPEWAEWFAGFQIVNAGGGDASLTGAVPDQAALHGLLARLRDLNLALVEVKLLQAPAGAEGVSQ